MAAAPPWISEIAKFYWLLWSIVWRRISVPNFVKIGQSVAKVLKFFHFSRWRPSPSWIFEIVNFYLLTVSGGLSRNSVPNIVKISRFFVAILRLFEFSRWPPPPSWIFEIAKFYWLLRSRRSRRISVPNFVKIGQSVAKILRFFDFSRWRLPPSWIFEIVNFLFAVGICGVQTHHCTKFRQNWSFHCADIEIFLIFKMVSVRHLGFVWGIFGPPTVSTSGSLSLSKIWLWSMQ